MTNHHQAKSRNFFSDRIAAPKRIKPTAPLSLSGFAVISHETKVPFDACLNESVAVTLNHSHSNDSAFPFSNTPKTDWKVRCSSICSTTVSVTRSSYFYFLLFHKLVFWSLEQRLDLQSVKETWFHGTRREIKLPFILPQITTKRTELSFVYSLIPNLRSAAFPIPIELPIGTYGDDDHFLNH